MQKQILTQFLRIWGRRQKKKKEHRMKRGQTTEEQNLQEEYVRRGAWWLPLPVLLWSKTSPERQSLTWSNLVYGKAAWGSSDSKWESGGIGVPCGPSCYKQALSQLLENGARVYSPLGLEWLPGSHQVTYLLHHVLVPHEDEDTN